MLMHLQMQLMSKSHFFSMGSIRLMVPIWILPYHKT